MIHNPPPTKPRTGAIVAIVLLWAVLVPVLLFCVMPIVIGRLSE